MSTEQRARYLLERMGYPDAQTRTAGDLVELADVLARQAHAERSSEKLRELLDEAMHQLWHAIQTPESFDRTVARKAYDEIRQATPKRLTEPETEWVTCPSCGGDEGTRDSAGEWVNCAECDGSGGWMRRVTAAP